ncbi:hypothetical protein COU18_00125 [Candidatus Kaiserbacteria bacterium CG10_big_fil_rev_8_21_14_0_10_51_14]|uniref:Uncharacterized protein n=1 Tax=Candidatus Kaiserbacteria bacterium CG10_big_fil_rev_8_21_14_0_10_51_14 TaxID=1974610 RepID=A0A2H0UCM5_9BACT|nr:MAG: hypothetical protein COU18_00125 [Candidatus Kaiserbacteria bacterium CG10_big_fil_rev_8_21_14_0_10_51_14]
MLDFRFRFRLYKAGQLLSLVGLEPLVLARLLKTHSVNLLFELHPVPQAVGFVQVLQETM